MNSGPGGRVSLMGLLLWKERSRMKDLLIRGLIAIGMCSAGMHGAAYAIKSERMNYRGNPVWGIVRAYLDTEWAILKGLGWLVLIALAVTLFVIGIDAAMESGRRKKREILNQEKMERERRAENAFRERVERDNARREAERKELKRKRHAEWLERKEEEAVRLKARSPEQVHRDAINDLTKGL